MSHSGNRPQPGNDGSNPGEESGLLSERSLTIMALSSVIAVLAGLSAGLTTGINIADGASPGWALAAGLTAGLAAAATAGLAAAAALHTLVTKRAALAASTGTPQAGIPSWACPARCVTCRCGPATPTLGQWSCQ
jgi:hypothetical protein